eukprot:3889537-Amphidinium_carterae.1
MSAIEYVNKYPSALEKDRKRFPGGTFQTTPPQKECSIPSQETRGRTARRAESTDDTAESPFRVPPRTTESRPRDPSRESRGPETVPKGPPAKPGPTMPPEERERGEECHH